MSEPIRVLHVLGSLDRGGAESRIMDIYRSINRNEIQFDFAIHTDEKCSFSDEVHELGGRIFVLPRFMGHNYKQYTRAWIQLFKNHNEFKIIHGHMTSTAFIYLRLAKKYNLNTRIAHSRSSNKDSLIKYLTSKLAQIYATDLLAVSKEAGISEFGEKNVAIGRVIIVPNAIEVRKYLFNEDARERIREELRLSDEIAVLHIGRFHKVKNHSFIIDIFDSMIKKGVKAKLFLIGDGYERDNIEQKVRELNLCDRVKFLGVRDDIPRLLSAMDILVFPSYYEGFPGVVLEAQASGLPCVVSDVITKEVAITNLVTYLSLESSKDYWVKEILENRYTSDRKTKGLEIIDSDYNASNIVSWYEKFYSASQK